ncbi:unnamed protein product [Spirodela intermedia]|uniref:Uncharacterized protein n=1 Tax=Spirodela intermedia TaxID=51605 RepID=A0A7I8K073_SPIIN|nr:unnamed protein product [Spirodela intermedia]
MTGAWRSRIFFLKEKLGNSLWLWIRSSLCVVLLISSGFVCYSTVSSWKYGGGCPGCGADNDQARRAFRSSPPQAAAVPSAPPVPTDVSHILFGIGGSARTWQSRRGYSELWWRPGETRGYVWLDEEPPSGGAGWPETCPPYRVSADASRFGARASAARIANIVAETYLKVVASGEQRGVRWLVMGDDDTVFFPENLAGVLGKYDHEQMWYVGGSSESVEQDVLHSYGMAFGGGGFAVSIPAAAELAPVLDSCLERYNHFYGSDQRVHACLSELGIPLTREPGFHQVDLRGDPYGMLAAHPTAPLVSLHHLDYVKPISPRGRDRLEALGSLVRASRLDPARTLMQSICYEPTRGWSVSVAWGYTVQLYPKVLAAGELEKPLGTFQTWRSSQKGPFTFNTRPVPSEPCDRPILFFFDRITKQKIDRGGTVSEYSVHLPGNWSVACEHPEFAAASKVKLIEVYAPIMDPNDWKKAPRRHCCETETRRRPWWGRSSTMEVRISPCRPGETITKSPP